MAESKDFGNDGETIARRYLEKNGYEILDTNWRVGHLEADIIAYKDERIIFVEVKTRKDDSHGTPDQFVDRSKQRAYIKIANAYMIQNNRNEEARFDIISVIINEQGTDIVHLREAYTTIG